MSLLNQLAIALRPLARLGADRRGNVLMMTAFAMIPLMVAVGFGIDYARAGRVQTKLNAAADAAVLAAVAPQLMTRTDSEAQTAAYAMFDQQAAGLQGVTNIARTVTVTPTSGGSLGTLRTVKIVYTARSTNIFGSFLKAVSLPIGGSATASASQPPSINFYIALDTSPSMLIATTTAGIANMKSGSVWKGQPYSFSGSSAVGCTFACHSVNAHQWNNGIYVVDRSSREILMNNSATSALIPFYRLDCSGNVYDSTGIQIGNSGDLGTGTGSSFSAKSDYCGGSGPPANPATLRYKPLGLLVYSYVSVNFPDSWWLAQNYSRVNPGYSDIELRTDAQSAAAAGVIQYAYNIQQQYSTTTAPPTYKMQFYTFDVGTPATLGTYPFGTMTNVSTLQSQSFPDLGAQAPLMAGNTYWTTTGVKTNNADTWVTSMLTGMKAAMPLVSGSGTTASPQNVLIIITDGVPDDTSTGISAFTAANITQCNAIKATGARIAILYTEYRADTIDYTAHTTFNSTAKNVIPNVAAQLQACATQNADGTYLMQTVSTDGSVSAALNTLFAMTVQTAKLLN